MSEITRTEKFLRACIDGEPCKLKPLTRMEKLLAELNETLAGGPSEVVILPETELTKTEPGMFASVGMTNLPAYPEVGMLYDVTMNGEAHTFPAIAAGSMGMESMGDVLLFDQALPYGVIIAYAEKAEQTGAAVVVLKVDDIWNPDTCVLSIKGKAATASAGGGFVVNATVEWEEGGDATYKTGIGTIDKTFDEILKALESDNVAQCHLEDNGATYVLPCGMFSEESIGFMIYLGGQSYTVMVLANNYVIVDLNISA